MIQVLPSRSFGTKLSEGLSKGLDRLSDEYSKYQDMQKQQQDADAIEKLTGMKINDPELRKIAMAESLRGQRASSNSKEEDRNLKINNLQSALDTINQMRSLRKKDNLGFGASVRGLYNPEAREDIGKYQTLGKSLIPYASMIPIRNQKEFEKLTGKLDDPYITDDEAKGVLDGMEKIISDSLKGYKGNESTQEMGERPPLTSFARK